jgi:hypothetical protein
LAQSGDTPLIFLLQRILAKTKPLELSSDDIVHLFKSRFGSELKPWLLKEGFTVSPELAKRILSTVKLTDVTLGQLMEMSSGSEDSATADKLIEDPNVTRLTQRT